MRREATSQVLSASSLSISADALYRPASNALYRPASNAPSKAIRELSMARRRRLPLEIQYEARTDTLPRCRPSRFQPTPCIAQQAVEPVIQGKGGPSAVDGAPSSSPFAGTQSQTIRLDGSTSESVKFRRTIPP
ncbi:hypothetical protein BJ912DRAFT_1062316 [Pholiota molesta]|nr:hypothetical protein BJ912DRAFT_1062316 [Pholiota molesta]